MSKNVQETVFEIIKLSKQAGFRSIPKAQIKVELKNSPLGTTDIQNYSGKKSRLECQLDQALYQLTKQERIKKRGKGKYSINTDKTRYRPIICRHLEERADGYFCPIKNVYIGDPARQCELLHGTDYTRLVKHVTPMCPGYTDKKPTKISVAYAKKHIALKNKKRDDAYSIAAKKRGGA